MTQRVGQMDLKDRYNEAAQWVSQMARDLASLATERPVDGVRAQTLAQNIGIAIMDVIALGNGLDWCEGCGAVERGQVDGNGHCRECAAESARNQRSLSRN